MVVEVSKKHLPVKVKVTYRYTVDSLYLKLARDQRN